LLSSSSVLAIVDVVVVVVVVVVVAVVVVVVIYISVHWCVRVRDKNSFLFCCRLFTSFWVCI